MTNTIQSTSAQPQLIAVSRLTKSALNARRTSKRDGIDELKASILSHGLMQNLVVTDSGDGTYWVIAGSRRLEAIHDLQAEGKLPEDFAVPCQIATEDHALEMSLAENTVRLAMHPADQFEAFAALIEQGASAADVASRFGVDESLVLKRMKLARVAPQLLAEYRAEGMTLECLMAYTITDDHRRQMKVFRSLQNWHKDDPSEIRASLTEKMIDAKDKLAQFVGLDAYEAAGGVTRADLFGDDVYLETPALLHKLAEQKLAMLRKELEAEGWGWVEINPDRDNDAIYRCGRIKPQLIGAPDELLSLKSQLDDQLAESCDDSESDALHERLDEIDRQLTEFVGFDQTQKRLAGCFVSIGHDGTPFVDKGLVRPEQRKALATLLGEDEASVKSAKPKQTGGLPESLRRSLAADRLPIAQLAIASRPDIALDLLTFTLATRLLDEGRRIEGIDVTCKRARQLPQSGQTSDAASKFAAVERELPTGWRKPASEAERFEALRSLPQERKQALLAACVALAMQPTLGFSTASEASACDAALALTGASVAEFWRPTKDNFLSRRNRSELLAIGRDVLGEQWSQSRTGDKKSSLVDQLDRAFSNPDKSGRTPEQTAAVKSWLPAGMGFEALPAPKSGKTRKLKTAA